MKLKPLFKQAPAWIMLSLFLCVSGQGLAQEKSLEEPDPDRPLWMRYPAISPDGEKIAFSYGGQIWVVDASGGDALPLTSGLFYSKSPVWSPDGSMIAFDSTRYGNEDVYIMPATGGKIRRLTEYSQPDRPKSFSRDGSEVFFSSVRLGDVTASFYAGSLRQSLQLYAVPVEGGRERLVIPVPVRDARPSPDGRYIVYTDYPSLEQDWRKHAISDATRDIWVFDSENQTHRQLTRWNGEDREPVWSADGRTIYYLSERSGHFNVWSMPFDPAAENKDEAGPGPKPTQVTSHDIHPVRMLSIAGDNTLVYSYDGEIYRISGGEGDAERVQVHISQSTMLDGEFHANISDEATEVEVSPDGMEFAIVARGDVFVVSALSGTTRRITSTPQEERDVQFSPDGRSLVYSGDRDGSWDVFMTSIADESDKHFFSASSLEEKPLFDSDAHEYRAAYSPDGKKIAWYEDRTQLMVMDVEGGEKKVLLPRDSAYSYNDGDVTFEWSPDSRWIAAITGSSLLPFEITLVDTAGEHEPENISRSAYTEKGPSFSPDGRAVLYISDREGMRASHVVDTGTDIYAQFLTQEALDEFELSPEQRLELQALKAAQAATSEQQQSTGPAALKQPQLDGLRHRIQRMTPFSTTIMFYQMVDSSTLVYVALQPGTGIMAYSVSAGGFKPLFSLPGNATDAIIGPKRENIYVLTPGGIMKYNLASGQQSMTPFSAEVAYDLRGEIEYIFDHVWRFTKTKFYVEDMHDVDWDLYGQEYRKYLPHIYRWQDFAELLSEMVGELNASHTGGSYLGQASYGDRTGSLGVYYDYSHTGAGMKVAAVLPGGPANHAASVIRPGAVILAVDGVEISAEMSIHPLLNHKAGKVVYLNVQPAEGGEAVAETIKPVAYDKIMPLGLAYEKWIDDRRAMIDELSNGRLAYVHVPAMDGPSYRRAFKELLGEFIDKEAVIVDVRFNGGGLTHDELIALLNGKQYGEGFSRDGLKAYEGPSMSWNKPSLVLQNAAAYSDGSVFPFFYKAAGVGSLVGENVPGTGTAVWWQVQLGNNIKYGVPQLGFKDMDGEWLENQEVKADHLIYNTPDSIEEGRDLQLEKAVEVMLGQLDGQQ